MWSKRGMKNDADCRNSPANAAGWRRCAWSIARPPRLAPIPTGGPSTATARPIAGRPSLASARAESADAEYHSSRAPGASSATRCGAIRPSPARPATIAVRPVRVSYSGPSWTVRSGSGVPSATPGGLHSTTSTGACSGRLGTSSARVSPRGGALLEIGAGAPDDTGLPRSRAGGDVAEAIGGGLHPARVPAVRLLGGAIALDELRLAPHLMLDLRLDAVGRRLGLAAARRDPRGRNDHGRQRESSHASHAGLIPDRRTDTPGRPCGPATRVDGEEVRDRTLLTRHGDFTVHRTVFAAPRRSRTALGTDTHRT